MHGPFRGMAYPPYAADKMLLLRLLGTYECELHSAIEQLCALQPDVIVNAGAGEGYYAVGLARRVQTAKIFAYDGFTWARHLLRKTVAINQVSDRVEIHGLITPQELERVLKPAKTPLLICDVEGYEFVLMDDSLVPSLSRTAVLLELHRGLMPNVTYMAEEMRERFAQTHRLTFIPDRKRTKTDLPPEVSQLSDVLLAEVDEYRFRGTRQSWLLLEPLRQQEPIRDYFGFKGLSAHCRISQT